MATLPSTSIEASASASASNFKGKLITYALTHGFEQPNYSIKNEGYPHAPLFRATVDVAGRTFTAPETFKHLKDAQHFVSKLALESLISLHQTPANFSSFLQGSKLCKTILYEYSVKKRPMDLPSYQTGLPEHGPANMFVSRVVFKNNTFLGPISKSKNDAEQNAARVVISSLLENLESRCLMSKVIQKFMHPAAAREESNPHQNPNLNVNASTVGLVTRPEEVTEKDLTVLPGFWTFPNNTCKSILKEYYDKKGCQDMLRYDTHTHEGGPVQAFVSSVCLEGNMYKGPPSKSKKEAEQAAARVAINCILGDPASKYCMIQAMRSKFILDPSPNMNMIPNPSTNSKPNEESSHLQQVSTDPKTNQDGDNGIDLMGSPPFVKCCPGAIESVLGQSEEKKIDPSPNINLISNPSSNLKPIEEESHLDQVSTRAKPDQVGDSSLTLMGSPPLVKCCLGSAELVLDQSEGKKVENLPAMGPSKNARKRARKKERMLEAKKVKPE